MANFSSQDWAQFNYHALTFGVPGTITPPINPLPSGTIPMVGWYASDNGLVRKWAGFKRKGVDDYRTYFLDVSPLTEIRAGDTLASASYISVLAAPNTISAGAYAVSGTRVLFTLQAGIANNLYALKIRFQLTSGAMLSRVVRVVVDEYT